VAELAPSVFGLISVLPLLRAVRSARTRSSHGLATIGAPAR